MTFEHVDGIIIDLKYLTDDIKKEFFLLDKTARTYAIDNTSELLKVGIDDRFWYFVPEEKNDIELLYQLYHEFCVVNNCRIEVYPYKLRLRDKEPVEMIQYVGNPFITIRRVVIDSDKELDIDTKEDIVDIIADILEETDPDVIEAIENDTERMHANIRWFIKESYSKFAQYRSNKDEYPTKYKEKEY